MPGRIDRDLCMLHRWSKVVSRWLFRSVAAHLYRSRGQSISVSSYLTKVDSDGSALKGSVVKESLGSLCVKGGVVDNKDSVEGLDGGKVVDLAKGLCQGLELKHSLCLKVDGLEVGDCDGVGWNGRGW